MSSSIRYLPQSGKLAASQVSPGESAKVQIVSLSPAVSELEYVGAVEESAGFSPLAAPRSLWDLSSQTRDQPRAQSAES